MNDPPAYPVMEDLRLCVRLLRYSPLRVEEFTYESNKPPHVQLNTQRQHDFVWRFLLSLQEYEQKYKKSHGRFHSPLTQILRHQEQYESNPTENVKGIWDRFYKGDFPSPETLEHPYWNNRAAVAAAAALLKYLGGRKFANDLAPEETLLQYGGLIRFWAGSLAEQVARLSLPPSMHTIAIQLAQDYVDVAINTVVNGTNPAPPPDIPGFKMMINLTIYGCAKGAKNFTREEMAELVDGTDMLREIPHMITSHLVREKE